MINTTPISQFIQQVRAAEFEKQRDVRLTIQQARMLSFTLTEVLGKLVQDYESLVASFAHTDIEITSVSVDGGSFGDQK